MDQFLQFATKWSLPYISHVFKLTQVGTSITQFSCTVIFITLFCTVNEEGILAKFVLEIMTEKIMVIFSELSKIISK